MGENSKREKKKSNQREQNILMYNRSNQIRNQRKNVYRYVYKRERFIRENEKRKKTSFYYRQTGVLDIKVNSPKLKRSLASDCFTPQFKISSQAIYRMFECSWFILFKDHMTDPSSSIPDKGGI